MVYGLWAFAALRQPLADVYSSISSATAGIPLVKSLTAEPSPTGLSYMTAGIIVAIMVTPIITSLTREVFATTPEPLKEAAYGLGSTRWEMIRGAVFPHSRGGVVSAVMIGLGRAIGETIAVALLIGSSQTISLAPVRGGRHARRHHPEPVRRGDGGLPGRAHRHGRDPPGPHGRGGHVGPGHRQPVRQAHGGERMTAVATASPGSSRLAPGPRSHSRRARNWLATGLIALAFLIAMVPLVFLVIYVVQKGSEAFSWEFLTTNPPFSDRLPGGGMAPAVVGTIVITGAAAVMAIPLGVLGGIYLNEYGGTNPLARTVRFLAEVMTGVPSIVMGLFIYTLVVVNTGQRTGLAGALALASLMLPIVIRVTDQMLLLVPRELREGSYALGSRRARTIRTVVLPKAAPGIVSGALLAVARAAGETAPVLFTIGIVSEPNWNIFKGQNTTLSQQIFLERHQPVRARAGAGLGLGPHADPHRVPVHHPGPGRDRLLLPPAGRMSAEEPIMETITQPPANVGTVTGTRTPVPAVAIVRRRRAGRAARRAAGDRLRVARPRGALQRAHRGP